MYVPIKADDKSQITKSETCVVSGLSSSCVLMCCLVIKESAEARLGGMIEQSLLKQISSLRPNHCGHTRCSLNI